MGKKVIRWSFGSPAEWYEVEEDGEILDIITGERRSLDPPVIDPSVERAQLQLQLAQNALRATQIQSYLKTPVAFEWTTDPKNPGHLIRKPVMRPTPTPQELLERFPPITPARAAPAGQRSAFKGTITTEDGRTIQLYEPEGREAFIRERETPEDEFGQPRTLFGGRPVEIRTREPEAIGPPPTARSPYLPEVPTIYSMDFGQATGQVLSPPQQHQAFVEAFFVGGPPRL